VSSATASTLVFANGTTMYPITALISFTIGSTDFESSGLPSIDGLTVTARRSLLGSATAQSGTSAWMSDMSPYSMADLAAAPAGEDGYDDVFAGEKARLTHALGPHFSAPRISRDIAKFAAYAGVDLTPSVSAAGHLQTLGGELTGMANSTAALLMGTVRSLKQSSPASRPSPLPPASSGTCSAAQLTPTTPTGGLILSVAQGERGRPVYPTTRHWYLKCYSTACKSVASASNSSTSMIQLLTSALCGGVEPSMCSGK
jgi:hypothetical protein